MFEICYHYPLLQVCLCPDELNQRLLHCLGEAIYYDEIASSFTRLQTECRSLMTQLVAADCTLPDGAEPGGVLTLEQAEKLASVPHIFSKKNKKQQEEIQTLQRNVLATVTQTSRDQSTLNVRVQASLAGAVVRVKRLPDKLNPLIRPLMEAVKKEENLLMQVPDHNDFAVSFF